MLLKRLELEWKIFFVAILILFTVTVPLRSLFERRIDLVIENSVDENLEPFLMKQINLLKALDFTTDQIEEEREQLLSLLARHRQWQSIQKLDIEKQKRGFTNFTYVLILLTLFITFFLFYRMTLPIKRLAKQVKIIGAGGTADIAIRSSGSLRVLEHNLNEMQNELETLRREAELRGMESAWRDIARIMAHEIKNPLTPMRLNVDRLEEQIHLKQEIPITNATKFVERMNRQLDSLEGLVNRFRSFSVDQAVQLVPVSLSELLSQYANDFSETLTTTIDGDGEISADRSLLQQVVLNIYKNCVNAKATALTISSKQINDEIEISFSDNGKGIEKNGLTKIFLPYITFTEGGSGIGLSVVKRIIESMDGTVRADSTVGVGFTLIITLKLSTSINEKAKK